MNATERTLGWALVGLQGLLFLLIGFWPRDWGPTFGGWLYPGAVLVGLGTVGVIWSGRNLGHALTPHPEPNRAGMAAVGMYAHVRHPMYASLIVLCLGVAMVRGSWVVVGWVVALGVFFDAKTRFEERFLAEAYPGYAEYAAQTGKFVPGVGRRRA